MKLTYIKMPSLGSVQPGFSMKRGQTYNLRATKEVIGNTAKITTYVVSDSVNPLEICKRRSTYQFRMTKKNVGANVQLNTYVNNKPYCSALDTKA